MDKSPKAVALKYDGEKERLLAFAALVEGTIQEKIGDLFPEMKSALPDFDPASFEPAIKEVNKLARKAVKEAGLKGDAKKFATMWAVREVLMNAGLGIAPEKKKLRGILKKI